MLIILCLSAALVPGVRSTNHCRSDGQCAGDHCALGTSLLQVRSRVARDTEEGAVGGECHTAVANEKCYDAVQWAMASGIQSNPEWYPGLNTSSGFEEFQAVLHSGGHGGCPEPCPPCHTAVAPEKCHKEVRWAMTQGIHSNPEWYPGLTASASFEDFQAHIHRTSHEHQCPMPCTRSARPSPIPEQPSSGPGDIRWRPSGQRVGNGWCSVEVPSASWTLKRCPSMGSLRVKVMTYNLFWWNLFGRRRGNGGSAGRLIAKSYAEEPIDVIGFQETDDVAWPMKDAGLRGQYHYEIRSGGAIAYLRAVWRKLAGGSATVSEDRPGHGHVWKRSVNWVRLQHRQTGKKLFVMNHHGPLPVGTGGVCGGEATGYRILKEIAQHAQNDDLIVMVGDFNSAKWHPQIRTMEKHFHLIFTGVTFQGVDHIFSNCAGASVVATANLGRGGSDHDALTAVFKF